MNCKCGKAITQETSFDTPEGRRCVDCFLVIATKSATPLTGEQRARLKREVKNEMAGVLPREELRAVIEEHDDLLMKEWDHDEEVSRVVNRIEQIAGLAMMNEMLTFLHAFKVALNEQEAEIQQKVRRIEHL